MDPVREKTQLLEEIENAGGKGPSPDSIRRYLRLVREQRTRESETVARWGAVLLQKHRRSLPEEELWLVHEQVALAAMDCQASSCAASCVNAVCREFASTSIRAKRLKGMYFEATDNVDRAERIYEDILKDDPSNEMVLKRKVAVNKTKGNLAGAAQALRTYLDSYTSDRDAWEELADIYTEMHHFKQAAFCYEELIMLAPGNLSFHLRYGDLLYTMGGSNNIQTALGYYCHAVEISSGTCNRALFGICNCLGHLKRTKASPQSEIGQLAAQGLLKQYAAQCPKKLKVVKSILQDQGLYE